jgi:hypothetical protein
VADGGQPVPGVPTFAAKWITNKKHVKPDSSVCFSQVPKPNGKNYLVVFSTSEALFEGLMPVAHTYSRSTPNETGGAIVNYGGTWDYSYHFGSNSRTTTTLDFQHLDKTKALYGRVFDQQGKMLAHFLPDKVHSRDDMLEGMIGVVQADTSPTVHQRLQATPLSVYYVNCDVDSQSVSTQVAESSSALPGPVLAPQSTEVTMKERLPPPDPVLDLVSTPPGAEIYVDGQHSGVTPKSITLKPGEHAIVIRKQDFSTWQRKLQLASGHRRISAYLEQKTLTLSEIR